jgi:polysaccharide biosynthesis transport protein
MDQPVAETLDLREYLAVLRTRKWTVLLVVTLVVGSTLFFSYRQTPIFQASARLLIKGVPTDASGFVQPPNLETEAEIVRSEPIAERVVEELQLDHSTQELIASLTVEPAAELSQVLQLSYSSPQPDVASEVPNSFAANYIEYKQEQALEALEAGTRSIQSRVDSVQERLQEVTSRIASPEAAASDPLRTTLETERTTLIARLGVLQQELDDFRSRRPTDLAGGQVIDPASRPSEPSSPNHVRNGLLAISLGLALGIGLAFLRERLDDRFKGRNDLIRALGVPVLATVPMVRRPRHQKEPSLAISADPLGQAAEAYKGLRTSIQFLSEDKGFTSLLVTSASAGEGKTVTTANLAGALAQSGSRVIALSADLRRPTLERYFALDSAMGLSDWLIAADEADPLAIIRDPGIPNLRIIPSGPIPPNPAELLTSRRFGTLIEILESQADLILIDSPPVFPVTDPLVLVSRISAVLLVVDANKTHRSAAVHAKEELERVGGTVIGSVYNSFDPTASTYGRYGTYSRYSNYAPAHPERLPTDPRQAVSPDDLKPRRSRSLFGSSR